MKRKTFLIAALVLCSLGMQAEDGVILHLNNGNKVGFVFSEKPVVKTGAATLNIQTAEKEVDYNYSEVKNITFGDVATTAINTAKKGDRNNVFRLTADGIVAEGLRPGETVSVFAIDGKLVREAEATNGSAAISLPAGDKSVYVVRTSNGTTFKFNRK